MVHLDLDQIDRMDAGFDAAKRKTIGEPKGAGALAGSDLEHRPWAKLGEQRRVHGEIEYVLHQRHAAPAHERRRALAGQQNVDAEFGAEAWMIMNARLL